MRWQKKKFIIVAGVVLLLAWLIRVYNLSDWLYFQADQVRNANHTLAVIEGGWRELPLRGPKAGGTNFHLGPISYWLETLFAEIFNRNHPVGVVYANLFFVWVSIILVYYYLRQGLSSLVAGQITILYAFSYVTIQYSRFSWNPNGLLFWGLLFVLAIWQVFRLDKSVVWRGRWFLVLGLSYGVVSQLHTTALLGYPGVFVLYWLYKAWHQWYLDGNGAGRHFIQDWKKVGKMLWKILPGRKYFFGALAIFMFLYLPLFAYDWQNHGENIKAFGRAFQTKTQSDKTVGEKLYREATLLGKYYTLNVFSLNNREISWKFKKDFWLLYWLLGWGLLVGSGVVIWYDFRRRKADCRRIFVDNKFDWLVLNFVWWFVFMVLFFPLAYKLDQMRFWFIIFLIPYVALGIMFEWMHKKKFSFAVWLVWLIILSLNLTAVLNWYVGLARQDRNELFFRQPTNSTLQQYDRVTYQKMNEAVQYMIQIANGKKICFSAPSKYRASYRYLFDRANDRVERKTIAGKVQPSYLKDCVVFLVEHTEKNKKDIVSEYKKNGLTIDLGEEKHFGVITVWVVGAVKD